MATNETETDSRPAPTQQPQASEPAAPATPKATPASPAAAAQAAAEPQPDPTEALRAELPRSPSVAAQAARLGVAVDAADAVRKGVSAETLRRTVLETLASRAEASR